MDDVTIRLFEPADAAEEGFDGSWPTVGLTGVAVDDGRVVCYGGIQVFAERRWTFFRMVDRTFVLAHAKTLHSIVTQLLNEAVETQPGPIFSLLDETQPRARAWLERLGFRPVQPDEIAPDIQQAQDIMNQEAWVRWPQ